MTRTLQDDFLVRLQQDLPVRIDTNDIEQLEAWLALRQKGMVNDTGCITTMGAVTAFSVIFELKTLDVMALAFVASRPITSSRQEFEWIGMEFKIKEGRIGKAFGSLRKKGLIKKVSGSVHKMNEKGFNELQLKALKRINRDRDSIFKTMRK